MPNLPDAHLSHQSPGRLRIKIPSKKGDIAYFEALKSHLAGHAGVQRLEVNSLTGSVLLMHGADTQAIRSYAVAHGLFRLEEDELPRTAPAAGLWTSLLHGITAAVRTVNQQVKGSTAGDLDLNRLAFLALFAMGILDIARGNFKTPAWYTAFWYASGMFSKVQSDKSNKP